MHDSHAVIWLVVDVVDVCRSIKRLLRTYVFYDETLYSAENVSVLGPWSKDDLLITDIRTFRSRGVEMAPTFRPCGIHLPAITISASP